MKKIIVTPRKYILKGENGQFGINEILKSEKRQQNTHPTDG